MAGCNNLNFTALNTQLIVGGSDITNGLFLEAGALTLSPPLTTSSRYEGGNTSVVSAGGSKSRTLTFSVLPGTIEYKIILGLIESGDSLDTTYINDKISFVIMCGLLEETGDLSLGLTDKPIFTFQVTGEYLPI